VARGGADGARKCEALPAARVHGEGKVPR